MVSMAWFRRGKKKKEEEEFDGVGALAVIIPALNEEKNIAAAIRSALEDRNRGEEKKGGRDRGILGRPDRDRDGVEVVVVDGGSSDATVAAARGAGAHRVLRCATRGRGAQIAAGVAAVGVGGGRSAAALSSPPSDDSFFLPPRRRRRKPDTLLFLHADSRLPRDYRASISRALLPPPSPRGASAPPRSSWGAFETVSPTGLRPAAAAALLSAGVALRTRLLGLPYGDQAIFVSVAALERVGGVRPLPLMEDVDLVERLTLAGREEERREARGRGRKEEGGGGGGGRVNARPAVARGAVVTSGRRWAERGLVRTTLRNLWTLARWKSGSASAEELAREYYRR